MLVGSFQDNADAQLEHSALREVLMQAAEISADPLVAATVLDRIQTMADRETVLRFNDPEAVTLRVLMRNGVCSIIHSSHC